MEETEPQVREEKPVRAKGGLTRAGPVVVPAVDILDREDALILIADMPGTNNESVAIQLKDNELTIRGSVLEKNIDATPIRTEYETGYFYRSFSLQTLVDHDNIEASIKDGVLTLILPKAEEAKPRQIAVKAG